MSEKTIADIAHWASLLLMASLLLGWIPARKAQSKGRGKTLWVFYGICLTTGVAMFFFWNPLIFTGDRIRDFLLTSDNSVYAMISNIFGRQRGLSYPAGVYIIRQFNGVCVVALIYWFMALVFALAAKRSSAPTIQA